MDTTGLTPKKMRKGKNGKKGTRYYDDQGHLVAKTCAKCSQVKPIDEFNTAKAQSDGYFSSCRPCASQTQKEYRYESTPEGAKDKYRKKYIDRTNEEFLEAIKEAYPAGAKECPECKIDKTLDEFYRNKVYSTGISTWCKDCTTTKSRKRQSRLAEADPDYFRKNNTTAIGRYKSRTDAEIVLKQRELYPTGNKYCNRCKMSKPLGDFWPYSGRPDGVSYRCKDCEREIKRLRWKREYEAHWRAQNIPFECYVCQGPYEQSDHVIPTNLGGSDDPTNRLPMCAYHNGSKNGTPLKTWLYANHRDIMDEIIYKVTVQYNVRITQ